MNEEDTDKNGIERIDPSSDNESDFMSGRYFLRDRNEDKSYHYEDQLSQSSKGEDNNNDEISEEISDGNNEDLNTIQLS